MNNNVTIAILVDGLRYDYINSEDTPFLYSLQETGISGEITEPFAFQLRPVFFAGLYPEDSNVSHLFWYDPEDSPFAFTNDMPIANDIFAEPFYRQMIREFIIKEARREERRKGYEASANYADLYEIPYDFLKYFAFSEKYITYKQDSLKYPTLFDLLRTAKLKWFWYAYPDAHDLRTKEVAEVFLRRVRHHHSFIYLHFSELDWIGHSFGPNSDERKNTIYQIDKAIENISSNLQEMHKGVEIKKLIFGDHGMVEIKRKIDLENLLKDSDLNVPNDYVYFLDSNQARFWFKNKKAKNAIGELLCAIPQGKILDGKDYENLRIRYTHKKFGEMYFMLDGGNIIYPNFFQRAEEIKGMHGYLPNVKENNSKFIISGVGKHCKITRPIEMVDLFPTIADFLGLVVPSSNQGMSLLNYYE